MYSDSSTATFPTTFQALPHPINDWIVLPDGRSLDRDLFDVNLWRRFEFSIFNPKIRARIVWSLTVPNPTATLEYIVFGGNCTLTPARVLVEEIDGESHLRLNPEEVVNRIEGVNLKRLLLEPGPRLVCVGVNGDGRRGFCL